MATNSSQSSDTLPIRTGFEELVSAVIADIRTLSIAGAIERLTDEDVVFVDLRDEAELNSEGKIPGAVHPSHGMMVSRGMLEFFVDSDSAYHTAEFGPGKEFILYSTVGVRSALSTCWLQEMGVETAANLNGGFAAWKEAGGPIEDV